MKSNLSLLEALRSIVMTKGAFPFFLCRTNRKAKGRVAVKIHSGEPGGHDFLSPDLIAPLVATLEGTSVECNTACGGRISTTESHQLVVEEHGFTPAPSPSPE
jgi:uncharacterized Fe-S center protein